MRFQEQNIKVYSNEYGFITRLTKKNKNDEWEGTYLPVHFRKDVVVENDTLITIKDAWLSYYINKEEKRVLYIFVNDFTITEK